MSLSTAGNLRLPSLGGGATRFLQVDDGGNLSPWTGTSENQNYVLCGDANWRLQPFIKSGANIYSAVGTKVGIGISSPANALDVSGNISSSGVVQAAGGFKFNSTDGVFLDPDANMIMLGKQTIGQVNVLFDPCVATVPTNWVVASSYGFVTTQINPLIAPLVKATLKMFVAPATGNGYIELDGKDNSNNGNNTLNINSACGRNTNINANNGNVNICSASSGNVGIGTTFNTNNRLSISGTNTGLSVITKHASDNMHNTKLTVDKDYAKALTVINTAQNGAGDENFIVYGDGRTRIGGDYTLGNENLYKLSVNGSMITEEVVIMLRGNWPDYVFSKNHLLMPLNKVEEFITKNSHLPNIPSAKEIKENGVNTAEMLSKQMEKIEELTLYMIQLKKEVDLLKSENNELRGKSK